MSRHRFEPGRLLLGLLLLAAGLAFVLDAVGVWHLATPALLAAVPAALAVAAVTGFTTWLLRRPKRGEPGA